MANINKLKISGTTYNIQDENATKTVELTQAQYDNLPSSAKTSNTLYIITDAAAGDLTNYYTKSETSGATQISTALNAKQDTLTAGSGITISGNVISAEGGGGASYQAGTNISIANDTINCTLPIKKITGYDSVIIGDSRNTVDGDRNVSLGYQNTIKALGSSYIPMQCFTQGEHNNVYNTNEAAFGFYNSSVQNTHVGGESGTTIFSVGNGTSNSARHNAFEIRQNGDIYINKDGQDVKLQDQLGGGAASSAITSGDTNAVAGGAVYSKFDEVEQVTAAALNALNDNFGGLKLVKLTQQEYNALTTKDSNTLYVIV